MAGDVAARLARADAELARCGPWGVGDPEQGALIREAREPVIAAVGRPTAAPGGRGARAAWARVAARAVHPEGARTGHGVHGSNR